MQLFIIAIVGFLLVGIGFVGVMLSTRWLSSDQVTRRLSEYISEETSSQVSSLAISAQTRDIRGSISSRIFLPTLRQIGYLLGRMTPVSTLENHRRQLLIAGNPFGIGAREFFGFRILFLILGFWMAFMLFRRGFNSINFLSGISALVVTYLIPILWLRDRVSKRQDRIRKGLPDALDMLTVCASAGLGFDQSMQRVAEHWETPIGIEFGRVISEMEMGLSRRDALRNMADRLEVSELSSFVSFLLQSDQLGMSISDTLHAQADQMRVERRFRAQEQAQRIPTRMLFPMVFLIFPALLAIVLGPALPRLFDLFSGF
jgi:tight adherence protein C